VVFENDDTCDITVGRDITRAFKLQNVIGLQPATGEAAEPVEVHRAI